MSFECSTSVRWTVVIPLLECTLYLKQASHMFEVCCNVLNVLLILRFVRCKVILFVSRICLFCVFPAVGTVNAH